MALPTGAPKPPRKVVRPGGGFPRLSAMRFANPRPDRNHLVAGQGFRHDPAMTKRVALYARCSTADRQTTENQIRDLRAVAEQHGWTVAGVFDDDGISGGVPREERPAMQRLLCAIARREIDMVAAWAVDRLGRSLIDLLGLLGELHAKKIDLYLHQQGLDTSTPAGRAMFQMLGLIAEFERAMIRDRVLSGLARARAGGTKSGKAIGRPAITEGTSDAVRAALSTDESERAIARRLGIGKGTVGRVRADLARDG